MNLPQHAATRILICLLCGGGLLVPCEAAGHSDPEGDIHPKIVAGKDQFSIYFQNNKEPKELGEYIVYKTEVSLEGKVLSNRVRSEFPKEGKKEKFWTSRDFGNPEEFYIMENGVSSHLTPNWESETEHISDLLWDQEKVWIVFAFPREKGGQGSYPFYLATVDRKTSKVLASYHANWESPPDLFLPGCFQADSCWRGNLHMLAPGSEGW